MEKEEKAMVITAKDCGERREVQGEAQARKIGIVMGRLLWWGD